MRPRKGGLRRGVGGIFACALLQPAHSVRVSLLSAFSLFYVALFTRATMTVLALFCVTFTFCPLVAVVRLPVQVQVIDLKD